jgi:hypothetical protein
MRNRSARAFFEIRAILLREWDPLSVGDNPHLADEYDSYIPTLYRLLENAPTVERIAAVLERIEKDFFGADTSANVPNSSAEPRIRAARALVARKTI